MEMEVTQSWKEPQKMEEDEETREGRRGNQVTSISKFQQNFYKITSILIYEIKGQPYRNRTRNSLEIGHG